MCAYRLKCNTVTPLTFRVTNKGIDSLSLSHSTPPSLSESLFSICNRSTRPHVYKRTFSLCFSRFYVFSHTHTPHGVALFWLWNKRRFIASLSLICNGHSHTLWDDRKNMQFKNRKISNASEKILVYSWHVVFGVFLRNFSILYVMRGMISIIIYSIICRYT